MSSALQVAYWCSGASQTGRSAGSVSRSCIAGAPEFVEEVREDRQQVACRNPDRQAQRVGEPAEVEAGIPCPHDVRPHTGLARQLMQMGKLPIFTGECGRDQRCKGLVQTLPDKSVLRLSDCSGAGGARPGLTIRSKSAGVTGRARWLVRFKQFSATSVAARRGLRSAATSLPLPVYCCLTVHQRAIRPMVGGTRPSPHSIGPRAVNRQLQPVFVPTRHSQLAIE